MVGFGVVEGRRFAYLRADLAVAGGAQRPLIALPGLLRRFQPLAQIDGGTVLRAQIIALAHALGWVVALPEQGQQGIQLEGRRVMDDQHHFGMAGLPGADLFVAWVGREAASVADRGGEHPFEAPKEAFRAPEAAHAEQGLPQPVGKRADQGIAVDEVPLRHLHAGGSSRQCLLRRRQTLLARENH